MDVIQAVGWPPTCSVCKSFIDVRQGNRFRCSCGKVTIDAPLSHRKDPPEWGELAPIASLLTLLRASGVARFEGRGISVSFHELIGPPVQTAQPDEEPPGVCPFPVMHRVMVGSPASQCRQCTMHIPDDQWGYYETNPLIGAKRKSPTPDEEQCTCGHKILTDHNEQGCLHGCALDTCGRQGMAGDDA